MTTTAVIARPTPGLNHVANARGPWPAARLFS
jgi:hypothetical protein